MISLRVLLSNLFYNTIIEIIIMITEKVMLPILLASNHPIVHLALLIAGMLILHDDHSDSDKHFKNNDLSRSPES